MSSFKEQVEQLKKDWATNPRWKNVKRDYTAEDVVRLRGSVKIDYTLAQCCALQFWTRSRSDFAGALDAYVRLCGRGGEAPFQDLVRSAGLVSPFAPGALRDVVREAAGFLGV